MADFPSLHNSKIIRPTNREFSLGEYPVKVYRTMSGAIRKRSFGLFPSSYTMELEYANVIEGIVAMFFDHYHGQQGSTLGFRIPKAVFDGYQDPIWERFAYSMNAQSIQWFYTESPRVVSGFNGLSTVSIALSGELVA
jgi:hypothetical protein